VSEGAWQRAIFVARFPCMVRAPAPRSKGGPCHALLRGRGKSWRLVLHLCCRAFGASPFSV